jgi:succinoglycan biosynthesis protein ExoM
MIESKEYMDVAKEHISVCICTYKRPELLGPLLEKIQGQRTDNLFTYSVVVVDNDAAQSAKSIISAFKEKSSISVDYYCEPEQNISLARNKALKNARGNYVAFIDDDEFPTDSWLITLLKACHELGADGIQGPVIPIFENAAPQWVIKGKFYERPNYPTGLVLEWRQGRTGNLLLKRTMIDKNETMFDPEFGSGGEDQDFFRRMTARGYVFKYCHEATAYEYIPPMRWKRTFLLKRALLRGKIAILGPTFNVRNIVKSLVAVPVYTASLPFLFLLGHHLFMKYLVKDFDHIGKVLALCKLDVIKEKYITE